MALIDRRLAPMEQGLAALVALARRCPDCPVFDVADLVPMFGRTAFTWRLTADQALALDEMTLRLKRELGRAKLDRAELLAALTGLAADDPGVCGALACKWAVTTSAYERPGRA